MFFEIPLLDGRIAYMKKPEKDFYCVVWVSTERFLTIWDKNQKNDTHTTQKKYNEVDDIFKKSSISPVDYIHGGIVNLKRGISSQVTSFMIKNFCPSVRNIIYKIFPTQKVFRFDDGITRTTWLINNGAQYFPVCCSPSQRLELTQLAGADL